MQPELELTQEIEVQLAQVAQDAARRSEVALTTLLGREIKVVDLETRYVPSASAAILMSLEVTHDHAAVGRLAITGKVDGTAFVVIAQRSIDALASAFDLDTTERSDESREMLRSMLREVSNIAASSYINAFADAWGLDLSPSTVSLDLAAEGITAELERASRAQGPAIVFRCAFLDHERRPQLSLVLLLGSTEVFAQVTNG